MKVTANGISIEVDEQGPPDGEQLLLIMGLGMQLVAWPPLLVQDLVSRGFRVIRMDNRDAGLSQGFDHLGVPKLAWAAVRATLLERYGIEIGGGLGDYAGKVWRIGCMGHTARPRNVTLLLGALREVLGR